jgi:hypothetical protein
MKNSSILTSAFYCAAHLTTMATVTVVHAGTNKTLSPTPLLTRITPSPVTPFPTESITPAPVPITPAPVPMTYETPAPVDVYSTPAPVEAYVPPPTPVCCVCCFLYSKHHQFTFIYFCTALLLLQKDDYYSMGYEVIDHYDTTDDHYAPPKPSYHHYEPEPEYHHYDNHYAPSKPSYYHYNEYQSNDVADGGGGGLWGGNDDNDDYNYYYGGKSGKGGKGQKGGKSETSYNYGWESSQYYGSKGGKGSERLTPSVINEINLL